jgi:putative transposase
MVRPAHRRAVVTWARETYRVSERRACHATGVGRSLIRYRSVRPSHEPLRRRLHELAQTRVRWGYRQLHVLLGREGWRVNHKQVYRLYREEGLSMRRRSPKRRRSAVVRTALPTASQPNEHWAMDFMHDTLADGRSIRVWTMIDLFTRECLALEVASTFRGSDVAEHLAACGQDRGQLPTHISVDNGTEFTSKTLDAWGYWNHVQLDFSRPGRPSDNPFIGSFNASVRRECPSQHWFIDLADARRTLDQWKEDYNNTRPHTSLAKRTPTEFRVSHSFIAKALADEKMAVGLD